ncbi:hypothetical protein BLM37_03290 [Candidatus Gracilibacteria bacterium GN02-873]|nr:hypothetical protein BLM37_03290 [Candidatus Gracilibacteria bacterium GN02-873]
MLENFKGKNGINNFAKNPQNINRKGRPKKGVNAVNAELTKKGYEPARKSDIEAIYMQLVNLPQDMLEKLVKDKKQPMIVRIVIRNMLHSTKGFEILEKILDRGIGKPTTNIEAKTDTMHHIVDAEELQKLHNLFLGNGDNDAHENS